MKRVLRFSIVGCLVGVVVAFSTLAWVDSKRDYDISTNLASDQSNNTVRSIGESIDLSGITKTDSDFHAKTSLYKYLSQANTDELLSVLGQAEEIADIDYRQEVQIATLRAFVHVDQESAIEQWMKLTRRERKKTAIAVFRELAVVNLDAAVVQVRRIEPSLRSLVITAVLQVAVEPPRSQTQLEELVENMEGNLNEVTRLIQYQQFENDLHVSRKTTHFTFDDQLTHLQQDQLLFLLAEQTLMQDGLKGMMNLLENQPNWNDAVVKRIFGDAISTFALRDVKQAFRDTLTMDGTKASFIRDEVLRTWSMLNPMDALEALLSYEPKNERLRLQKLVVQTWGQVSPAESLERINEVPRHLTTFLRTTSIRLLADTEPDKAKEIVESIVNPRYKTQHAQELVQFLTATDPQGTVDWVLTNPALDDVRHQVLATVISSLVDIDPDLALETALVSPDQPKLSHENWHPYRYDWNLPAVAIGLISHLDVDLALNMVSRVDAESQLECYQNIGRTLVQLREYERALELANILKDTDQNEYFGEVLSHWAGWWGTQLDLVDYLDKLPKSQQSKSARELLWRNTYDDFLTDSQLVNVKKYLNKEDADLLDHATSEKL